MLIGFIYILLGIIKIFQSPESISAAILSAASGIIVNFIGATLLVVYKSTMSQATEYVTILERINAVGMSIQILDRLEDEDKILKQKTTADLAMKLLDLYSKVGD